MFLSTRAVTVQNSSFFELPPDNSWDKTYGSKAAMGREVQRPMASHVLLVSKWPLEKKLCGRQDMEADGAVLKKHCPANHQSHCHCKKWLPDVPS